MGNHRDGYTSRHRATAEPEPTAVCPACQGTRINPAGLDCVRCAGTGLPDFRVATP